MYIAQPEPTPVLVLLPSQYICTDDSLPLSVSVIVEHSVGCGQFFSLTAVSVSCPWYSGEFLALCVCVCV